MKKFTLLAGLAALATVGSAFATFYFSNGSTIDFTGEYDPVTISLNSELFGYDGVSDLDDFVVFDSDFGLPIATAKNDYAEDICVVNYKEEGVFTPNINDYRLYLALGHNHGDLEGESGDFYCFDDKTPLLKVTVDLTDNDLFYLIGNNFSGTEDATFGFGVSVTYDFFNPFDEEHEPLHSLCQKIISDMFACCSEENAVDYGYQFTKSYANKDYHAKLFNEVSTDNPKEITVDVPITSFLEYNENLDCFASNALNVANDEYEGFNAYDVFDAFKAFAQQEPFIKLTIKPFAEIWTGSETLKIGEVPQDAFAE